MNTYWIASNIVQGLLLVLLLAAFFLPQSSFGSRGYSGYGQVACLVILLGLFDLAAINTCAAGCVAYASDMLGKGPLSYAIGQLVLFIILNLLLLLKR